MAIQINNVSINATASNFRSVVVLNDVTFNFDFFYNTRMAKWIMSIYDENDNAIVQSIPVLINQDFLVPYKTRFPDLNSLTLFFTSTDVYRQQEATRNSLGDTVIFCYSKEI